MTEVEYENRDGVAWIYLNRPERLNAVTYQLAYDLCAALERASEERVAAAVLGGRGRAFCSGHDLKHEEEHVGILGNRIRIERIQDVTRLIRRADHPVIAAVQGYAVGAGAEFALACDLIIAATDAKFGFPEVDVGLAVTGGLTHLLPRMIGLPRAKELVLLGQHFSAQRALDFGMINEVVDAETLESRVAKIAEALKSKPRVAMALAKKALDLGAEGTLEDAFETEINHSFVSALDTAANSTHQSFRATGSIKEGG